MTTTTDKQPAQQKQTVQQAAALLQPNFDRHAPRILSLIERGGANRLWNIENDPAPAKAQKGEQS